MWLQADLGLVGDFIFFLLKKSLISILNSISLEHVQRLWVNKVSAIIKTWENLF